MHEMTKILIDRSTVEQALKALKMMGEKYGEYACPACDHADAAIAALREMLAQPEQEPVGLLQEIARLHDRIKDLEGDVEFLSLPTQRKPLTDEEIDALVIDKDGLPNSHLEFARAIEAAHGITGET